MSTGSPSAGLETAFVTRIGGERYVVKIILKLPVVVVCASLLAAGLIGRADGAQLGSMQANRMLFLGNSITCCNPNFWGLAACVPEKDYVHLLTRAIEVRTGATLRLDPIGPEDRHADGSYSAGDANVVNIADIFERGYATYAGSNRLQQQLAWKADIVVLQFGENVRSDTFDAGAFESGLRSLVTDLKQSSNPEIFMTSYIMGEPAGIDKIKRDICAEDPAHRVFVDLSALCGDRTNFGDYDHPNDKGMAIVADTLFNAMVAHSVPEPTSLVLSSTAMVAMLWCAYRRRDWRKRRM